MNFLSGTALKIKEAASGMIGTAVDKVGDFASTKLLGWTREPLNATLGRFFGDVLLVRFGERRVLTGGGLVAAAGLLLSVLVQHPVTALLGFAMVGAGVSLGAPILYGASARVPGMAPGAGLATMNTFGMVGFLAGPAVIGFIAKSWSLPMAFVLVAIAAMFWAWRAYQTNAIK